MLPELWGKGDLWGAGLLWGAGVVGQACSWPGSQGRQPAGSRASHRGRWTRTRVTWSGHTGRLDTVCEPAPPLASASLSRVSVPRSPEDPALGDDERPASGAGAPHRRWCPCTCT